MLTSRLTVFAALLLILGALAPATVAGASTAPMKPKPKPGPVVVHGGAGNGQGGSTVTTTVTNSKTGQKTTVVHGGAGTGSGNNATMPAPDPCKAVPLVPQPDPGSPWWDGKTAAEGQVVHWVCTGGVEPAVKVAYFQANGTVAAPPPPDPAVLAADAEAQVETLLPPPSLTVSPDLPNNVDKQIGLPVTYVNLWFWFWTTSDTWQTFSNTAALNGVTATTTARPVSLTYTPGNGDPAVVCTSAGRPWTDADQNLDPSTIGGCGYKYTKVTPLASQGGSGPITGTLTLNWQVTWTSNVGQNGELDGLSTSTDTPAFAVEQIQVVTR